MRIRIATVQGLQPALGFFLKNVECEIGCELSRHDFLPYCLRSADRQAGRKFERESRTCWAGNPCRGQEAPQLRTGANMNSEMSPVNRKTGTMADSL